MFLLCNRIFYFILANTQNIVTRIMFYFKIADESDTTQVAFLLEKLFREVGHTPDFDEIASIFGAIEEDDRHSTLLAYDAEDNLAGIITLCETISLYAGGYVGVINELYVLKPYRSEGLGKRLIDEAKALGISRGWKRLEVTTPGDEYERTLHFYEKEGFFRIGPRYKFEL
jgi:GNAT superfamily N-acetyltransferase